MTSVHAFWAGVSLCVVAEIALYFGWKALKAGGSSLKASLVADIKAELDKLA